MSKNVVHERTHAALLAPKVGMGFHEWYSFWIFVVEVGESQIVTLEGGGHPSWFPETGEFRVYPDAEALRARCAYGSIPGYHVMLSEFSPYNVIGWAARRAIQAMGAPA